MSLGASCDSTHAATVTPTRYVTANATGNVVAERRPFGLRQVETRDRIHRRANGRRLSQRARDEARRGSGVVTEQPGHDPCDDEARRGDDRGQGRVRESVALQTAEKLRAGAETDREQEQQEKALFDLVRQRYAELPDQHAREQRARHGAELEAAERYLAEQVTKTEHQEERDLRVRLQDPLQPGHDSLLRLRDRRRRR